MKYIEPDAHDKVVAIHATNVLMRGRPAGFCAREGEIVQQVTSLHSVVVSYAQRAVLFLINKSTPEGLTIAANAALMIHTVLRNNRLAPPMRVPLSIRRRNDHRPASGFSIRPKPL